MNSDRESNMDSNIPSYLTTPSTSIIILPPVSTKVQELPYHELCWDDFERLCLRIVRLDSKVEHCQLLGIRGQNQQGIDVFARKQDEDKYEVYQSKRISIFNASILNGLVQKFLDGNWKPKTSRFTLCASSSLRSTSITTAFEENVKKLGELGIKFVKYDSDELNQILRNQPEIVDDFFGREWVKLFCSEEAAAQLNLRKRLDSIQVIEYRKKLGEFYKIVFNTYDPGIPSIILDEKIPIEERFILPDVMEKKEIYVEYTQTTKTETPYQSEERQQQNTLNENNSKQLASVTNYSSQKIEKRVSIEDWLVQNKQSVILGEPGSGKSTLIRYLIIDLLQDSPRLSKFSEKWGFYLPVWIPFALCSQKISHNSDISIKEILYTWFKKNGREDLFVLVEQALEDERLLLLIDGLDESKDELSAKTTLDRINIFIEDKKIALIATSRPYGYIKLENRVLNAEVATLAHFSNKQQVQLSLIWFKTRLKYIQIDVDEQALTLNAEKMSKSFIEELRKVASVNDLAKVPMLLCILIALKMQNAILPQSRFQAYEEILEYFITRHPQRRIQDSDLTENPLISYFDDSKFAFSLIANYIQNNSAEGLVERETAKSIIKDFLITEYGNNIQEAIRKSTEIINIGQTSLGILVEKSQLEIGFFHRSFQEYLTAYRLSKLDIDEQIRIICGNINNPLWKEVILCFIHLIKRPNEIKKLIEQLRDITFNEKEKYNVNLIIYEIIFGNFDCPYELRKTIAEEAFNDVETHFWNSYKENVLSILMGGLNFSSLKNLIEARINSWFPNRILWRNKVFNTFKDWENKKEVIPCLLKNLYDEEIENKLSAALCLAEISNGKISIRDKLTDMSLKELDLNTRAAAFEALLQGWPNAGIIDEFIKINSDSCVNVLKLMSIKGKVKKQIVLEKDLDDLLNMLTYSNIYYAWKNSVIECILEGWKGTPLLKNKCLSYIQDFGSETFITILIIGFPNDDDIALIIQNQLENDKYPFSILDGPWRWIGINFKNNKLLSPIVQNWILNQDPFHNREVSYLVPLSKTESVKRKLISQLEDKNSFPHWTVRALLENWGIDDSDVNKTLINLVNTNTKFASQVAFFLPQIITDKSECLKKLIELLKNPESHRQDFILDGIIRLGIVKYDDPLIDYIIDDVLNSENLWMMLYEDIISMLVTNFSQNRRVEKLALTNIPKVINILPSVSIYYNHKPEIRDEIISYCTPLSKNLRNMISTQLGEKLYDKYFAHNILSKYQEEIHPNIKIQTSIGFYENVVYNNLGYDEQKLSEELIKLGPEYQETREAAFCGTIALNKPELIRETKYKTDYSIHLKYGFDDCPSIIKFLLKNWEYLNINFGDEIWKILDLDVLRVWTVLSNYVDEYPYVKEQLINFVKTTGIKEYEPPLLQFLNNHFPKSKLLADCCLESINGRSRVDAGYILGTQFEGDEEIYKQIYQKREVYWLHYNDGFIIALCKGWKDKIELDEIYGVSEKRNRVSIDGEIFLICLKSTTENVMDKICELIRNHNAYLHQLSLKEIIRRIKNDESLEELMTKKLFSATSIDEKVSLINLLNRAIIFNNDLKDWLMKEMSNQREMASPEIGYDLTDNKFKSVMVSILSTIC